MTKKSISFLLMGSFLLTGFCLSGFDFAPQKWIRDIGKLWERTEPSVKNVTFWDFNQEQYRGIRAFLYTVPKERENRMVDLRLHRKMEQFLSFICQEVITLDAFEDSPNALFFEQRLDQMVNEWKLTGKVNPQTLFAASTPSGNPSPPIDVDIMVFLERIHYDQQWKGDDKYLVIGVNAVAFEMDYGTPIYQDRIMLGSPWSGESGTVAKAEHAVLLQVADAMGEALQKNANEINQEHLRLERQELLAHIQDQIAHIGQIVNETKTLQALVNQAQERLKREPGPEEITGPLQMNLDLIKPLLKKAPPKINNGQNTQKPGVKVKEKPKSELTPDDLTTRQALAQAIEGNLRDWDNWKNQEEERQQQAIIAAQPSLRQQSLSASAPQQATETEPVVSPTRMVSLPQIDAPKGNLFNREWLRPSSPAIKPGKVSIVPVTGSIRRPDIQSTPLSSALPDSFLPFQNNNLPPPPSVSSATDAQSN